MVRVIERKPKQHFSVQRTSAKTGKSLVDGLTLQSYWRGGWLNISACNLEVRVEISGKKKVIALNVTIKKIFV